MTKHHRGIGENGLTAQRAETIIGEVDCQRAGKSERFGHANTSSISSTTSVAVPENVKVCDSCSITQMARCCRDG